MNLYLISQKENNYCDTHDSAVVAASDEDQAKRIHPLCGLIDDDSCAWSSIDNTWASTPDNVTVKYLGVADPSIEMGVILASFNAG